MGVSFRSNFRMKFYLLAVVAVAGVMSGPASRNACPTLEGLAAAFESHFGVQIPDGVVDCFYGGDNCPWDTIEDFVSDLRTLLEFSSPHPVRKIWRLWTSVSARVTDVLLLRMSSTLFRKSLASTSLMR